MEELAHLGQLGAGPDEALGEVSRVAGGESNTLDARDVVHLVKEVGEGHGASAGACDEDNI